MGYVIAGAAGLIGFYYLLRWFTRADPAQVTFALKIGAIAIGVVGIVLLAVGGRLGLVMVLAGVLVPLYLRWRNARRLAGRASGSTGAAGGTSHVDTAFFAMTLDHDSGALDGEIRRGVHRGRRLSTLDLSALLVLLAECAEDAASEQVLSAYLDRHHPGWRDAEAPRGADAGSGGASPAPMTQAEAWRILGLDPGADEAAIREAHRRLMLKFHPDHGGSAWFAARINEARDLLLGR